MKENISFKAGDQILIEGEEGEAFFILRSGTIGVRKGGKELVEIDGANSVFGEMSAILQQPRTCTIVAKTDVDAIKITQSIEDIIKTRPEGWEKLTLGIIRNFAKRLSETTNRFTTPQNPSLWTYEDLIEQDIQI